MNAELVIPSLLALVAGLITYVAQKKIDRQEKTRERHFEIYVEIVEAICDMANAHNREGVGKEDALSRYFSAKMKFSIVASDEAMEKFIAFDERLTSGERVPHEEFDQLLAQFLKAVRKENLGSTAVADRDLILITPFGKSLRTSNYEET